MTNMPRLVHILTSAQSVRFLKGMLAYLRERGFDVVVISAPGDNLRLETTRGLKRFVLGVCERCDSALAHRVICDSESLRSLYLKLGYTTEAKACVLGKGSPNGIYGDELPQTPEARERARTLRAHLGIPDGAPVIGFVGRLARDKGVPELLDAFDQILASLPDTRLLILGELDRGNPIPESYVKRLRSHPHVVMTGFVPDPDSYYAIMDVLEFPSYREGLAGPPLEAGLVAEIPSVAFEATGTVDAVCDGVTGTIVPRGDVAALVRAAFYREYVRLLEARSPALLDKFVGCPDGAPQSALRE